MMFFRMSKRHSKAVLSILILAVSGLPVSEAVYPAV